MTAPHAAVLATDLPLPVFRRGKVRDVYDLGRSLLIVATDRISAFDCIMPEGIPDKGRILTQVANFWFDATRDILPNHLVAADVDAFPAELQPFREELRGRAILVQKTRPLPVECVVRGYLAGSGLKEYQKSGTVCGIPLPPGLRNADELPEPIFTPSTKAEIGTHDENITFDETVKVVGPETAERLRDLSLRLYREGARYAETRGIIIADTKFEFGVDEKGSLVWIDEALTPDSSRFWPKESYRPGGAQPSFDKQFVRDFLLAARWDKKPPAPHLPSEVIETTRMKYEEALRLLTGQSL